MTPEEQRQEIKDIIAFYEERGWDWLNIISYRAAVFTGHYPLPRPGHRSITHVNSINNLHHSRTGRKTR